MNIDNLKKARENIGLTQSQVADRLGISDGTYKNYEQGKREPNNTLLSKIADLYEVSTDYLLGRTNIKRMATEQSELFTDADIAEIEKRIIAKYTELNEDMRAFCIETFQRFSSIIDKSQKTTEQTELTQQPVEPPIIQSKPQIQQQRVQPPVVQSKPQIPQQPAQQPNLQREIPPQKSDIQILKNSEVAVARSRNGAYKPLPTDEQMESFEEVKPGMI